MTEVPWEVISSCNKIDGRGQFLHSVGLLGHAYETSGWDLGFGLTQSSAPEGWQYGTYTSWNYRLITSREGSDLQLNAKTPAPHPEQFHIAICTFGTAGREGKRRPYP